MTSTSSSIGLETGTIVGERYRIIEPLGVGAMGQVYRVEHIHMAKVMAMKILHKEAVEIPTLLERFAREAKSIAKLDHPNIVRITDFGVDVSSGSFMVTELLEGEPLSAAARQLTPPQALEVIRQILAALEHAHGHGIVHRDLKPDNVMLVSADPIEVKVLDFGLAKITEVTDHEKLTQAGTVFGTPRYMSPEQASGDPVDHRTDLYAAGVLLWELLMKRPMVEGSSAVEILTKQITEPAPPLSPDLGEETQRIELVVHRALEKAPEDRYGSAAELSSSLAEFRLGAEPDAGSFDATLVRAPSRAEGDGPAAPDAVHASGATVAAVQGWMSKLNARVVLIAGGVASLLLALVLIVSNLSGGGAYEAATEKLAAGDLSGAKVAATAGLAEDPDDVRLRVLLGHVAFLDGQLGHAVLTYQRAIEADPAQAGDVVLQRHALELMDKGKSGERDLVDTILSQGSGAAADFMEDLAQTAKQGDLRRQAYESLERVDEAERLGSAYLSKELEVNRKSRCEVRKWYVTRLIALDDPEIRDTLEKERGRKGGFLNLFSASDCMKKELDEALRKETP